MRRSQLAHRVARVERRHAALDAALREEIARLRERMGEERAEEWLAEALRVVLAPHPRGRG